MDEVVLKEKVVQALGSGECVAEAVVDWIRVQYDGRRVEVAPSDIFGPVCYESLDGSWRCVVRYDEGVPTVGLAGNVRFSELSTLSAVQGWYESGAAPWPKALEEKLSRLPVRFVLNFWEFDGCAETVVKLEGQEWGVHRVRRC